jgi:hypothetical protein
MALGKIYGGAPISRHGNALMQPGDGPGMDAFARLRVSDPIGLFESTLTYDKQPLLWNEKLTGTATIDHVPSESAVRMSVAASGDRAERRTRIYTRYQPGKSQLVYMTFNFGDGNANVRKQVGYFDEANGIYLEEINGQYWVVRRSSVSGSPVETRIAQADWNVDTFSGLQPNKAQILIIDLEWLGVGRVRVGFVIDGEIKYVHEFLHANNIETVYMTTAQLPMSLVIETIGPFAGVNRLTAICGSIISEGGADDVAGFPFGTRGTGLTTVDGTNVPLLSIRPKATFNSIVNRVQTIQRQVEVYNNSSLVLIDVIYNGTLTGASWTSVDDDSTVEMDESATAITGGTVVLSFMVGSTNQAKASTATNLVGRLPLSLDIDGANPTPLTIVATNVGAAGSCVGAINWQEYR